MHDTSFQALIPDNFCFGCGPGNPHGLRLESRWSGPNESVCTYQPEWYHAAGPKSILNGGIIATLIDCHCVCTAMAAAYRAEGREIGSPPHLWYATGSLKVKYLRPTPIDLPVHLTARIEEAHAKKTLLSCVLSSAEIKCAEGKVIAVRTSPSWREA